MEKRVAPLNSAAKVDENSESAKHFEWEKMRFVIGGSRRTNEFGKTLDGVGLLARMVVYFVDINFVRKFAK